MPTISIKDEQGDELLTTNLPGEGLGRYFRSAASLRAVLPLARLFSKPIAAADGARELALTLDTSVPVGRDAELSLGAGASATIGLHQPGSTLFSGSDLQVPVTVPNGTLFASFTIEAVLNAGLAATPGHVSFGFGAGTAVRYAYFHPIDLAGAPGTVGEAVKAMLSAAVFPADTDDLARLPVGSFASLAGEGELSFNAQASLGSSTTLLATPGLPIVGTAAITAGATASVKAEWAASGEFELRVSKPDAGTVRLAFHRRRGRSLAVSAKAMAGISATVRGNDLLETLMKAISPNPEADLLALVDAGLGDAAIEGIQQAIAASIDRSLTLSAQLQVSALREHEALFAYDVDLARLDAPTRAAITEALHGRLAPLEEAAGAAGAAVRIVASAARQFRARKTSWRINLLGIVNVASFVDLVRDGSMTFDFDSGALTAADKVTSRRIRVSGMPLESDGEKLRRVLFESLLVTAAYQASRVLGGSVALTAEQMYVEQRDRTRRRDLEERYRLLIALGLCDETERDARLGAESDFGNSTLLIENRFDQAACDAMFLKGGGEPHPAGHFETIARAALLALMPAGDPERSYRRLALEADTMWQRVRTLGGDIDAALPEHIRHNALKLNVVRGDVFTIVWWASAMHRAGVELAVMRKFLGQRDAASLAGDQAFLKARARLSEALGRVVATTEARFDDPWEVLAMDAAAARLGRLEGTIISKRFAARYADTDPTPLAAAATPTSRGARAAAAAPPARARAAARDWTAEERALFAAHVVNLRDGRLSDAGSFSSSIEQVTRIFTELIPAYAQAQQRRGNRPRVMFYAHGGLVEEQEGLLPVLARRRFWELNDVYPVYFVWETGLRETLTDILGGALRPTRTARGPVTDAAIEALARPAGRAVWSQMKRSAEHASAAGGGARLVAELTAGLWKALKGEIELHALGHSAGAIFHAFFLPLLVSQRPAGVPPVDVRTLHLLAPAITTELFKQRLQDLIGAGKPITHLTTYTMADELERADHSMRPYGKSLLYLVSGGFEDAVATPILGLRASLERDLRLIRFFGLAGTEKVADINFSKTSATDPLNARTTSITHGGFDNDVPTMTSVVRRVRAAAETSAVVDYFEEVVPGFDRPGVGMARSEAAPARSAAAGRSRSPSARSAANDAGGARKKWTVMVWMAGDNNLESFGDLDITEMKRVGSNQDIDVVVQFDSMRDDRTRRYHISRDGSLDDDIVQELGETNTGDPAVAIDFFRWAIEQYPAERLLGVVWNHGSGIDDTDVYAGTRSGGGVRGVAPAGNGDRSVLRRALSSRHRRALFGTTVAQATHDRAIAFDDSAKDFLDNVELKRVLVEVKRQTGRELDVLGFDACLMNMIEVAYQMKGTARLVVGSEELEPGEGWPYDAVLEALSANPDMAGAELATRIVELYGEAHGTASVTQSALDLARLEETVLAVDLLAKALTKAIRDATEYAAVTKSLNGTQRFDTADFVDLGHFCQELAKRTKVANVKAAAKAAGGLLKAGDGLIIAERHKGASVSNASGAAIYFPRGPVNKAYAKLDFAKQTAWPKFLDAYHKA